MNMNPATILKLMNAKNQLKENHPKLFPFLNAAYTRAIKEGSVIEVKVTSPEGESVTTNIKVKSSDMDIFRDMEQVLKN